MRKIRLFKFFNKNPSITKMEIITDRGNGFYNWNGKLYQSDIIRSCIRPKARAIGKLTAQHIREQGKDLKINPEPYINLLLKEPNPFMSMQTLLEKVTTHLALNNNAFIYIHRDNNGFPVELLPLNYSSVQAIYNKQGTLFLKFNLNNGNIVTYSYEDIIHLRQDFNENDLFGDSPAKTLMGLMEVVNTTDQSIINAIRNSNVIKWLLKYSTSLRPEDLEDKRKEFVKNNLSTSGDGGGAVAIDSKVDAKQVEPKDYVPNAVQMDKATQRLYSFFNTNEKIIQNKYTEDEWISYYEGEVEPLALQLSLEFSRKLFTRKQRIQGDNILFEGSNLQHASLSTKLQLVQMVDRSAMLPNEWRRCMNLPPIEGGDKPLRRLDTTIVGKGGDN